MISVTASSSTITATASGSSVGAAVNATTVAASASGGIGPQGVAGNSGNLGDLADVQASSVAAGDLLRYSNGKWRNYPEVSVVDGGNFGEA